MKRQDHNDADDADIISAETGEKVIFADVNIKDAETGKVMSFKRFIQNILSGSS